LLTDLTKILDKNDAKVLAWKRNRLIYKNALHFYEMLLPQSIK